MDFRSYLYIAPEQVRFITVEENYLIILEGQFWLLCRILQRSQIMSHLLLVSAALTYSNVSNFSSKSEEHFFYVFIF